MGAGKIVGAVRPPQATILGATIRGATMRHGAAYGPQKQHGGRPVVKLAGVAARAVLTSWTVPRGLNAPECIAAAAQLVRPRVLVRRRDALVPPEPAAGVIATIEIATI
jgi:hypothetical protein